MQDFFLALADNSISTAFASGEGASSGPHKAAFVRATRIPGTKFLVPTDIPDSLNQRACWKALLKSAEAPLDRASFEKEWDARIEHTPHSAKGATPRERIDRYMHELNEFFGVRS